MRTPSTASLKAFELAARAGSFKAAAEKLSITPSAVSYRLKHLEEELGVELFHRGVGTLSLTDAGVSYFRHVEEFFRSLELATRQLIARFGGGSLRLRAPPFFASEFLLPRLGRLHALFADTDFQLETNTPAEGALHDVDIAIVSGRGPWAQTSSVRLLNQSYIAACAPTLLEHSRVESVADLDGVALLVHAAHKGAWELWAQAGGLRPPRAKKRVVFDTLNELVQATERGLGVGLIPVPLTAARLRSQVLVRLFGHVLPSAESYHLLVREADAERAEVRRLREWLLQELAAEALRQPPLRTEQLNVLPGRTERPEAVRPPRHREVSMA